MLNLTGAITRSFIFPAPINLTICYYSDLIKMIHLMPHITLIHTYAPNQVRVLYETVELGSYTIRVYTDLESQVLPDEQGIEIYPVELATAVPVETKSTMRESVGQGLFSLSAQFFDLGHQTRVEYTVKMQSELKRPRGMRLMPKRVVNRIAQGITENRTREIIDGFIKETLDDFPQWLAEREANPQQKVQSGRP
ncbi:MAG TPA: DUF1997 domain-containing protein [Chloroflexi bacterium]|nr:DUF1997 domain-containing protein [Chloroflexota bacterium]